MKNFWERRPTSFPETKSMENFLKLNALDFVSKNDAGWRSQNEFFRLWILFPEIKLGDVPEIH